MIADKLRQVADNLPLVYEAGKQNCTARHFSAVVTGDGTGELMLPIPFAPDLIEVVNHDPVIRATRGTIAFCQIDFSALGQLSGLFGMTSGPSSGNALGTYTNVLMASSGLANRCRRNEDGTMTLSNFSYDGLPGVWGKGVDYMVTAVRCVDKSDRQRIEENIRRLPENGTYKIYIQQEKMEAAFTREQWNALIAERPGYTFVMV